MRRQVAVAEAEPVLTVQPCQFIHDRPGLASHSPARLLVVHACKRVGHRVEVGADVQSVQLHVVAHVDDRSEVLSRKDADEPQKHPGGPDAAAQGHQHPASIGGHQRRARPRAPGTIAARMPIRIPLDRHDTVVSVLREAARVNADLEAYVEPAGERERRALTFAQWDRAAEGVAGYLERRGVTKGDVVCLLLPSCIDYAVLYAALQRLGAITSGINPRMGATEIAAIVDRTSPVLIVADPEAATPPRDT